ncbi:hypothetical protein HK097_008739, partial [Rhizophlyctis rosea]
MTSNLAGILRFLLNCLLTLLVTHTMTLIILKICMVGSLPSATVGGKVGGVELVGGGSNSGKGREKGLGGKSGKKKRSVNGKEQADDDRLTSEKEKACRYAAKRKE